MNAIAAVSKDEALMSNPYAPPQQKDYDTPLSKDERWRGILLIGGTGCLLLLSMFGGILYFSLAQGRSGIGGATGRSPATAPPITSESAADMTWEFVATVAAIGIIGVGLLILVAYCVVRTLESICPGSKKVMAKEKDIPTSK